MTSGASGALGRAELEMRRSIKPGKKKPGKEPRAVATPR